MKIVKCKSCGAPIVWIETVNGKAMPCDAEAVEYQENRKGNTKRGESHFKRWIHND